MQSHRKVESAVKIVKLLFKQRSSTYMALLIWNGAIPQLWDSIDSTPCINDCLTNPRIGYSKCMETGSR